MQPRILVGVTASFHKEYCLKEFLDGFKKLTYKNKDVLFVENSKDNKYFDKLKELGLNVIKGPYFESPIQSISASRNLLIEKTIRENYDYYFSLDQDVVPPSDVLERLSSHKKKAICGIYFNRMIENNKLVFTPGVYKIIPGTEDEKGLPSMQALTKEEIFSNKLLKVVSCGAGCLLIHKTILKNIRFREDLEQCEDRYFCIDLFKNNIELYCDTSVKCKHFILNRPYLWRNGKLIKREDLLNK